MAVFGESSSVKKKTLFIYFSKYIIENFFGKNFLDFFYKERIRLQKNVLVLILEEWEFSLSFSHPKDKKFGQKSPFSWGPSFAKRANFEEPLRKILIKTEKNLFSLFCNYFDRIKYFPEKVSEKDEKSFEKNVEKIPCSCWWRWETSHFLCWKYWKNWKCVSMEKLLEFQIIRFTLELKKIFVNFLKWQFFCFIESVRFQ